MNGEIEKVYIEIGVKENANDYQQENTSNEKYPCIMLTDFIPVQLPGPGVQAELRH